MQADGVRRLWASLVRADRRRRIDALIDYFGGPPAGRVIRLRRVSAARPGEVRGGRLRRAGWRPAWI